MYIFACMYKYIYMCAKMIYIYIYVFDHILPYIHEYIDVSMYEVCTHSMRASR